MRPLAILAWLVVAATLSGCGVTRFVAIDPHTGTQSIGDAFVRLQFERTEILAEYGAGDAPEGAAEAQVCFECTHPEHASHDGPVVTFELRLLVVNRRDRAWILRTDHVALRSLGDDAVSWQRADLATEHGPDGNGGVLMTVPPGTSADLPIVVAIRGHSDMLGPADLYGDYELRVEAPYPATGAHAAGVAVLERTLTVDCIHTTKQVGRVVLLLLGLLALGGA